MKKFLWVVITLASSYAFSGDNVHSMPCQVVIDDQGWSVNYAFLFSKKERHNNKKRDLLYVEKMGTISGTQIIVAWNALRPETGQFVFSIRLHNADTGEWSSFHKVADWGGTRQISCAVQAEFSRFLYARLQIDEGSRIDGIGIRVDSDQKNLLDKIHGLFVTIADFKKFNKDRAPVDFQSKKPIYIQNVPLISQILLMHDRSTGLCSPTALCMTTSAITGKNLDPLEFADYVYDPALDIFGHWAFNTAHAYEIMHEHAYCYPVRLKSIESLYNLIEKEQCPIVVSVTGKIAGAPKNYPYGHLLPVVGIDPIRKVVICHDSADREVHKIRHEYPFEVFIPAWHRSHCLTYKIMRKIM